MRRQLLFTVALFTLFLAVASGQDAKKAPPKVDAEVDIHFIDGSTVRASIESESLDIETAYGKLSVPVKDIRFIEFGTHMPDGHADKIQAAIKKLGNSDFREREKAAAALIELGPFSYAAVVDATRTPEAETAKRAKEVVQKLQAKFAKKDLKASANDRVRTSKFQIVGRIVTANIKVRSEYFGAADLRLADLRKLRNLSGAAFEVDVAVDASQYSQHGRWLATDFEVDGHSAITITATGQVDLAPESPGQIVVGPSGYQVGNRERFGKRGGFGGSGQGMLVGKIGQNGPTFTIGERFEGTPSQEGTLYLQITPSTYSQVASGKYEVKATVK